MSYSCVRSLTTSRHAVSYGASGSATPVRAQPQLSWLAGARCRTPPPKKGIGTIQLYMGHMAAVACCFRASPSGETPLWQRVKEGSTPSAAHKSEM